MKFPDPVIDHENCSNISKSVNLNLISCIIVNIQMYYKQKTQETTQIPSIFIQQ